MLITTSTWHLYKKLLITKQLMSNYFCMSHSIIFSLYYHALYLHSSAYFDFSCSTWPPSVWCTLEKYKYEREVARNIKLTTYFISCPSTKWIDGVLKHFPLTCTLLRNKRFSQIFVLANFFKNLLLIVMECMQAFSFSATLFF